MSASEDLIRQAASFDAEYARQQADPTVLPLNSPAPTPAYRGPARVQTPEQMSLEDERNARISANWQNYRADPAPMAQLDEPAFSILPGIPTAPAVPTPQTQREENVAAVTTGVQQSVAAVATTKRETLSGVPSDETIRRAAVIRQTGSGIESATPLEHDLATLSHDQIRQRFGETAGRALVGRLHSSTNDIARERFMERDLSQTAGDIVSGVGSGAVNTVGGVAALAAGAMNANAGQAVAAGLEGITQAIQGTQSPALQSRRAFTAERTALDAKDSDAQFQRDIADPNVGATVAHSRRIARDLVASVSNMVQDPTTLSDGIASGAGSMLAVGPLAKGLQAIGRAAMIPAAVTGSRLVPGAVPLVIGATEAGGSFVELANTVGRTKFEDLDKNSPMYRALIAEGMSPEDARTQVANRTALTGAAITAPFAMAAGNLVARFEGAPLRVPTVRAAGGNLVREFTEEGIQGGAGGFAQNVATQNTSDENKSLSAGVGEAIGTGALFGLGTASALQAPGVAGQSALLGLRAVGSAALALGAVAGDRAAALNARTEANSPVADSVVLQAGVEAQTNVGSAQTTMADAIQTAVDAGTAAPEQVSAMQALGQQIIELGSFSPEELSQYDAENPLIGVPAVAGATNRAEYVQALADTIKTEGEGSKIGIAAAFNLVDQISRFENLTNSDPTALEAIPEDHAANAVVESYNGFFDSIQQSPKIIAAMKAIQDRMVPKMAAELAAVTDTTDVSGLVQKASIVASLSPSEGSLPVIEKILMQARAGTIKLTKNQEKALQSSKVMLQAISMAQATETRLGLEQSSAPKRIDKVSGQVLTKLDQGDAQRSAMTYTTEIVRKLRGGNLKAAKEEMAALGEFVEHMQNKLKALNQHVENGGTAGGKELPTFQALNPSTREWYSSASFKVHLQSPGSVKTAQRIAVEAGYLFSIFNGYAKAFPELGVEPVEVLRLSPKLGGKAPAPAAASTAPTAAQIAATKAAAAVAEAAAKKKAAEVKAAEAEAARKAAEEAAAAAAKPAWQTPVVTEEAIAPTTVAGMFPRLIGGNNTVTEDGKPQTPNMFWQAFRLPKKITSRLLGLKSPLASIQEALESEKSLVEFTGVKRGITIPANVISTYAEYLGSVPALVKNMQAQLDEKVAKKNVKGQYAGKGVLDMLDAGVQVTRFRDARALNLVERSQNNPNKVRYNPQLLESALLAALQWVIVGEDFKQEMTPELASTLSGMEAEDIGDGLFRKIGRGLSQIEAQRSLAQMIQQFWGLSANDKASESDVQGIPLALAGEILHAMMTDGLVTREVVKLEDPNDPSLRDVVRYVPFEFAKPDAKKETAGNPILLMPGLIENAVLVESQIQNLYGDERAATPKHQLHAPDVPLTSEQEVTTEKANNTVYTLDVPALEFGENLGIENLVELYGAGELTDRVLNEKHKESLDGKNTSIRAAFASMVGRAGEMRSLVTADKLLHQIQTFFGHEMSVVGRLQQRGSQNPQASKYVREILLPTWATLDLGIESELTDAGKEDHALFALAQAQMLGIKIHTIPMDRILEELDALLSKEKLGPVVQMMREWHQSGRKKLPVDVVAQIKAAFAEAGVDVSPMAMKALLENARWQVASEADRKSFTTSLYIEADGVTNGVANAVALLATGPFSDHWVQQMARGGLSFDPTITTMNTYRGTEQGKKDTYENVADKTQEILARFAEGLPPDLKSQFSKLQRLMHVLLPGFKLKDREDGGVDVSLHRSVTKNPVTVTLYGAGAKGIAAKVAELMMDELYASMSDLAEAQAFNSNTKFDPILHELLTDLTRQTVISTKKGLKLITSKATHRSKWDAATFELTSREIEGLRSNIEHLFVSSMSSAVSHVVGSDILSNMKLIQKSVQAQSIAFQFAFSTAVEKALADKAANDPNHHKGDFLSKSELRGIRMELFKSFPLIKSGIQNFFPANSAFADVGDHVFGSDFQGTFTAPAQVHGPMDAGVKGAPMLNIGYGDGVMIQKILGVLGVNGLPVFDGFNLSLSDARKGSQQANEAVLMSWQANIFKDVGASFDTFLGGFSQEILDSDAELRMALARVFMSKAEAEKATGSQIMMLLKSSSSQLASKAISAEERRQALKGTAFTVDQMAAAASPHTQEGDLIGGDGVSVADGLNARIKPTKRESAPARAQASKDTYNEDEDPNAPLSIPGIRSQKFEDVITELLHATNGLSREQMQVINRVLRGNQGKNIAGLAVYTGTALELSKHFPMPSTPGIELFGWFDPNNNHIVIVEGPESTETLIHELIHATTYSKVLAHYTKPEAGVVADSIGRLELLMEQFLTLDETSSDYADAVRVIREGKELGTAEGKADALNEYMAWSLANKALAKTQKDTTANPLVLLVKKALDLVKRIIFGKANHAPDVGTDMFTNLMFHTAVVAKAETATIAMHNRDTLLFQSRAYGTNSRLTSMNQGFDQLFGAYIRKSVGDLKKATPAQKQMFIDERRGVMLGSAEMLRLATDSFYLSTPQESDTFLAVTEAYRLEMELDPNAVARLGDLFKHALKHLDTKMLMDPLAPDQKAEEHYANIRMQLISGKYNLPNDPQGRSGLLPMFLGLAATSETLRKALRDIPVPKAEGAFQGGPSRTMDEALTQAGGALMRALSARMANDKNTGNVSDAIDRLTRTVLQTSDNRKGFFELTMSPFSNAVNGANDRLVQLKDRIADKVADKATKVGAKSSNPFVKYGAATVKVAAQLTTEKGGELVGEGALHYLNSTSSFVSLREAASDLIGRLPSNASVWDMIKQTRAKVQQMRQRYLKDVPLVLSKNFARKLTENEWSTLHAVAKTDWALLAEHFTQDQVLALASDASARLQATRKLEASIKAEIPATWARVQAKSEQLAIFMTTGRKGNFLLSNAAAISKNSNLKVAPSANYVSQVDQLVTLYALNQMSSVAHSTMTALVQETAQTDGLKFALSYLVKQRKDEMAKATVGQARLNHYKGHIPSLNAPGGSLIIRDDKDFAKLVGQSYERVGDYGGSEAEAGRVKRGYYFRPTSARSAFNQGIFQNIQATASGVDPRTGFSDDTLVAGRIMGPSQVRAITLSLGREGQGTTASGENLSPVFDGSGNVIAYERSVDPLQLARLNPDTHLGRMIGVWRGRQVEEAVASQVNEKLVDNLHGMLAEAKKSWSTKKAEFVDIWDPAEQAKDPVVKDAANLMTFATRDYAHSVFGDQFLVRREMLNDALGYRKASVTDAWTGETRWSPATQKAIRDLAITFGGNDAYKYLANAERFWQGAVQEAKLLIVVKSIVVPMANFASNVAQLLMRGVPLSTIIRDMPRKLNEVHAYASSLHRFVEAEAELRAAQGAKDVRLALKLEAEIQNIEDGHRRLSIWPLIEAGEFTSISDAGVNQEDVRELTKGKLASYVEGLVEKLPEGVKTAGRYAIISRETALFKGLEKSVQYGDFLGKALMYDHLTKAQGKTKEEALGRITEEFVNYDRLPGRGRGYLEDMGLLWFYHFKLRSTKVALSVLRNNPLQVILGAAGSAVGVIPDAVSNIGTPLTDNVFSKAWEGTLGYSVGPGMGLNSPSLNPWWNITN